jgi:hypothetical protein
MSAPSAEHDIGQLSPVQKLKIRKANVENVVGAGLFPVAN